MAEPQPHRANDVAGDMRPWASEQRWPRLLSRQEHPKDNEDRSKADSPFAGPTGHADAGESSRDPYPRIPELYYG